MKYFLVFLLVFILNAEAKADEATLSLGACKNLRSQIEHYNELRKRGGSARQMESWKRSRKKLNDKFLDGNCKKYGKAVW